MTIEQIFFQLIRVSLGTRICLSHTPRTDEWGELYTMAKKQSLVGVCFAGVQRLQQQRQKPPEMLYLTWMGMAAKIQQRNEVVNKRCVELQEFLAEHGFKSCILKGQATARYYGDLSTLRQSGDIDVWVDGGRERIIPFVKTVNPNTSHIIKQHADLDIFDDIEVEVHYSPSELFCPIHHHRLQKWFKKQESQVLRYNDGQMNIADPEFDAVFLLAHIYKHLLVEGIGLRQMMDYFCMLRFARFSIEEQKSIVKTVKYLGMGKLLASVMYVLKRVFGLSEDLLLCAPDEKNGTILLDEILIGGNFGKHDPRKKKGNIVWRLIEPRILKFSLAKAHPLEYLFAPIYRLKQRFWMIRNRYSIRGLSKHE